MKMATVEKGVPQGTGRELAQIVSGVPASDGDGVKLTRIIGSSRLDMVDPFLLLDFFSTDQAADYIGGFPAHPHRGFQTVTYMLAGRMRHKDSTGHEGVIERGGVQWMSAGRGVVHSEMPEQESGLLSGLQLWVNLPAARKMEAPTYQEFSAAQIPTDTHQLGVRVKVIAGATDHGITGPVSMADTDPLYLDVTLVPDAAFEQAVPEGHSGFLYVLEGSVQVGGSAQKLSQNELGVFGPGHHVQISAGPAGGRFLLIAGRQLNEPVARGGPFVMNTEQEVRQAFADYRAGRFQEV